MKTPSKQRIVKEVKSWSGFVIFLIGVYFANNAIQDLLGKKAFAETGLPQITLAQALELAKEDNKYVVADLSALWCGTCRKFDQTVLSDNKVKKALTQNLIFARIDSESPEASVFIDRYGAKGYPTIMLLNAKGQAVRQLPLTFEPKQFLAAIAQISPL